MAADSDVHSARVTDDVRMRGFARRATVETALSWLDAMVKPLAAESVPLRKAAGRVLANSIVSGLDVPGFDRAMMDGFAVRAAETQGASSYNGLPFAVVGQALPGQAFEGTILPGQTVRIMTGAPMPLGADAVLPAELAEDRQSSLLALGEVSPGKHVGRRAEDISAGEEILPAGRRLRPQDLGVIASIGLGDVSVIRRPRVRLVITGDELLAPGSLPDGCRIVDANGTMLEALVRRDGGEPINGGIVPDRPAEILAAMQSDADVVLVSGGSSVGQEDHAPMLLAQHGELAIHGVAMRPSSPAGMGTLGERLVLLLPGNPVSCLCAYDFFAGRAIRGLGGRPRQWPYRQSKGVLRRKISSLIGRLDYARVRWVDGGLEPLAVGGASILSSTTRADGFVIVPADSEGYPPGTEVDVFLYDVWP